MNYEENISKKVRKSAITTGIISTKPFKSGQRINTIKTVVNHPILNVPAYTFEEDSSVVECRRCTVVEFSECNAKSL